MIANATTRNPAEKTRYLWRHQQIARDRRNSTHNAVLSLVDFWIDVIKINGSNVAYRSVSILRPAERGSDTCSVRQWNLWSVLHTELKLFQYASRD